MSLVLPSGYSGTGNGVGRSGCYLKTPMSLTQNTWNNPPVASWDQDGHFQPCTFSTSSGRFGMVVPSGYSLTTRTLNGYVKVTGFNVGLGIMFYKNNTQVGFSGASSTDTMYYSISTSLTAGNVISMYIWVNDTGDTALAGEGITGFYF